MNTEEFFFPETFEFTQKVHFRIQQRSAKKNITIVEGLGKEVANDIVRQLKTRLGCSGTLKNDQVQFSGDQRRKIADFLVEKKIVDRSDIVMHGA